MSDNKLLEDYLDLEPFAEQVNRDPRTVRRWMNEPDGLPYTRIGNSNPRARPDRARGGWIFGRMRKPRTSAGPVRRKAGECISSKQSYPQREFSVMKRARITKRPYTYNGKTEDRWLVLWTDLKGSRREKWCRNKRHAEAYAGKIDREIEDNVHIAERASVTFGEACEAWLRHEGRRANSGNLNKDLTRGALAGKQSVAKNHLLPHFGKMKLHKITTRRSSNSSKIKRAVFTIGRRGDIGTASNKFSILQ